MSNTKRLLALEKERGELVTTAQAFGSIEDPTDEQIQEAKDAVARVEAIDEQMATIKAAQNLRKLSPAVSHEELELPGSASSAGVSVSEPNLLKDPWAGFKSAADFSLAVLKAYQPDVAARRVDERFGAWDEAVKMGAAPSSPHKETHTAEGRMVPPAMKNEIWSIAFDQDDILGAVNPEPTSSNSVEWLADETTPWGSTGVQSYWRAENSQMTATKLDTDGRDVKLHELYAFVNATEELLQDAPRLNRRLTEGMGRAIGWKASDAIMNGTGAGQPLGWFVSSAKVSQAKEGSQTATTINATNVYKMFGRVIQGAGADVAWYINPDASHQLSLLKIGNEPAWTAQNSGMKEAPAGRLLGKPVVFSEHCATLGTVGDIQLVNRAGYAAFVKDSASSVESSMHLHFDYNVRSFRLIFRLGGQPYLAAAVTPPNSSVTRSHFVTLDTRA